MSTPNRTSTIPIITTPGTYITNSAGYAERPRLGGTNYVSPPMASGSHVPPDSARQRKINGLIVYNTN